MRGPQAGFCVRCGCVVVCREGRAAADRTYNRTVVSPGRAPDRSEPEDKNQIQSQRIYQEAHLYLKGGSVYIHESQCHMASPLFVFNRSQRAPKRHS